ncbi:Aste57867_13289 [Aphanomyces stellatus]|uniref:Aste57867_13289 protein n=1 Tax=Aphanomyces stellatus TaxID=120398 RepID=A0A485KZT1_9STRA|nr:hypothetical protein As57867_013240 [Aphanomyces stellatus]VFT90128.1 Aste57867_13289 [Aphanomyces stellatus]
MSSLPPPVATGYKVVIELARLRKYRAFKKAELKQLRAEASALVHRMTWLRADRRQRNVDAISLADHEALAQLLSENKTLRGQIERQSMLLRLLWAQAQWHMHEMLPPPTLSGSILVAHPEARRQGLAWLSERVYHTAMGFCPREFDPSMEDRYTFQMHTGVDEVGQLIFTGTEIHGQHTYFCHFKAMADVVWNAEKSIPRPDAPTFTSLEEWTHGPDNMMDYYHGSYGTGDDVRILERRYNHSSRVVITYTFVATDECFPNMEGRLQINGYGWTIIDCITDSITRVRHSTMHFPPITTHGVATVSEMGLTYGVTPEGNAYREAHVERIRSAADAINDDAYRGIVQALTIATE